MSEENEAAGGPEESKADKFKRLAEHRVNNAIAKIGLIGNLSASSYDFNADQVEKILSGLKAAVDEAHKAGKPVAVHAHAAEAVRRAILAGADTVEHGALMDDAVIDLLVEKHVVYVPNLYLAEYYLANGQKFHFNEEQLRYTRDFMKPRAEAFAKAAKKGAKIVFGTDAAAGMPGHTAPEFERRVALGVSPLQAIVQATSTPAKALGMADKIGDLKPGMFADIIAVEGNPLEDIKALGRVAFVMKEGKIYKQ